MNLLATIKNKLKKDFILEISLKGDIPEENEKISIPFIKNKEKITVFDLENIFESIDATSVKAVLFNISSLNIGLSRANLIRENIFNLSQKGIETHIYLENPGNIEYFIASAANKIYMPKWSTLNLIGLSSQTFFLKNFFEKIYVEPEIEGKGNYKSAAELFTRNGMSKYNREMINSLLDHNFDLIKEKISGSKNFDLKLVQKIFDEGPYLADDAKDKGLIDEICYYSDIKTNMCEAFSEKIAFINERKLLKSINLKNRFISLYYKFFNKKKIVGVVTVNGMITDGTSKSGKGYMKTAGATSVIKNLKKAEENKNVAAILVRVLSPGGSALGSDLIRSEIERICAKKPVVISMSDVAASGGYMLSLSADKIFADEFTLTGSIGVVAGKFNVSKLMDFLEINHETIGRGKNASLYSALKSFTTKEKETFNIQIDKMYENFVELTSQCRNLGIKSVEKAAQGRVWSGSKAKELQIIDETGSLKNAVEYIKNKIGIDDEKAPVYKFYRNKIDLSMLGKSLAINYEVLFEVASLFSKEKVLALMPFFIRFK